VSVEGSPYPRFKRALQTGKLAVVLADARGVPHIDLTMRWKSWS
jgi:hypothetical protein